MHARLTGVAELVRYFEPVHGIFLPSIRGQLEQTPVPPLTPLTLIKNKQQLKERGSAVLMFLSTL